MLTNRREPARYADLLDAVWANPAGKVKQKHIPCIVTICRHAKSHFFQWSLSLPEMILRKYLKYLLKISNKTPEEKIGYKTASNKQLRIVFVRATYRLAPQPREDGKYGQCFFPVGCEQPTRCMAGVFESNSDNLHHQQLHHKYMCPGAPSLQMLCSCFELKM